MNRKRFLAALVVLATAITVFSLTRPTQPTTKANVAQGAAGQPPAPDLPDQVAYRHLFRYVTAIKQKGDELEKQGKDASSYRTHFKRIANLSDYHARLLDQVAAQYMAEVQPVNARAHALAEAYKAQYPGGKVPHGEKPAPPPAELKQLGEERDAITLRYRDNLRNAFGDGEFNNFHNNFVKRRIAQDIQQAGNNQ